MDSAALATRLEPYRHCRRWWVAYSGGLDSRVLLELCWRLARQSGWPPLAAIHVNHQLNPAADAWADHCRDTCERLGLPLTIVRADVQPSGEGIEAAARQARYRAFETLLAGDELLLQAHHADDQAETVLLRLLRGAAPSQLAAIPARRSLARGELFRPLLKCTRDELAAYARSNALQWIEDASNADERFDRNYLRHSVTPRLARRWPRYRAALAQVASQAADMAGLLAELATVDLASCVSGEQLMVSACQALSPTRRDNLLRFWLDQRRLPAPSAPQLQQMRAMLDARPDAEPVVGWKGVEVRRFRDRLYAMAPLPELEAWRSRAWDPATPIDLPGSGQLIAVATRGAGLRQGLALEVRPRQGGERCRPLGRKHSQTLRRLLQERGVPPWWRNRLPLVYSGDDLAAVADLWVCEGFQAVGDEPGWLLEWVT